MRGCYTSMPDSRTDRKRSVLHDLKPEPFNRTPSERF